MYSGFLQWRENRSRKVSIPEQHRLDPYSGSYVDISLHRTHGHRHDKWYVVKARNALAFTSRRHSPISTTTDACDGICNQQHALCCHP